MSYDPSREDEKLEARIFREVDRRFVETNTAVGQLRTQIEALDTKLDAGFAAIEVRKRENWTWTVRLIITTLLSFLFGSGVIGFLQFVQKVLER